ncbi:MAG: NAD(P)/FAD-dependent oxidoreductase [Clostridia bacterium]|nr:NAD(P)/FAD-dependent oxidoreductase [Clostridia bacterium]
MTNETVIIGAGAAGMMAAIQAARGGKSVTLLERNDRPGRKIVITGKGRCNVTNAANLLNDLIAAVPVNGRFLYSAFSAFMPQDTMEFFEEQGVPLKIERGNRVFPVSDSSLDIVDALYGAAKKAGVKFRKGRAVELVINDGLVTAVKTEEGDVIDCSGVIIATGGKSYPGTGSTGDGYDLAVQAGHTVTQLKPSLVPLEAHEGFCSQLQGLSLRNVAIRVEDTEKYRTVYEDFGEMIFTHYGVSGPIILSASSHMRDMKSEKYVIHIDLKPALTYEQLDKRVVKDFTENANKDYVNSLGLLLPRKLIPVIARLSGIKASTKTNQITREQRAGLVELLKDFKVTVTGFRPIEEAIVTSGGIKVSEVDPKTMKSKLVPNLAFAGEVLDVDAYTGGFNLQIAFSTGYAAGNNI